MSELAQRRAFSILACTALLACSGAPEDVEEDYFDVEQGVRVTDAVYELRPVHSDKCADIEGRRGDNGAKLTQWDCLGGTNQRFQLSYKGTVGGEDLYEVRPTHAPNKCLDVSGVSSSNGAAVHQWDCHNGNNQRWRLQSSGSNYQLVAHHSGKCLDVSGVSTANGAALNQWDCHGGTNQQFRLVRVDGSSGGGTGGGTTGGRVFSQCRFHFGTIDSIAKANAGIRAEIDYFTPGWMGYRDTFDQSYVCDDTRPGGLLNGKVPVVVAYVAAFYVKRHFNLCDCNVNSCGAGNDLCRYGAQRIKQNLNAILNVYRSYAQGYANCYGTTRPIVFQMEPDWYQYTYSEQTSPMTPAEASSIMNQFVSAIRQYLPNAVFSMDISPWVAPNNGSDNGAQWYSNFNMNQFAFINTSGGGTEAANTRIRSSNNMTWAGVRNVTGKPILADTGYGANGVSAGHDANWDNPTYINARMRDGVIGISQYNPNSNWGATISRIRGQLGAPSVCP